MKSSIFIFQRQVVFSQWCRKGYAIFASLKRQVKIGHLSVELCNASLKKSVDLISQIFRGPAGDEDLDQQQGRCEEALSVLLMFLLGWLLPISDDSALLPRIFWIIIYRTKPIVCSISK
jgi:hypothetical protein